MRGTKEKEYALVIAGAMTRAAMRSGKRAGIACFLAYEDDTGKRLLGLSFSDGLGQPFGDLDLSDEEYGVVTSVLTAWEREYHGRLPWIDFGVVATMSPDGPAAIGVGSSTVPRSLLKDRSRAEGRRLAHSEPMATQMGHFAASMLTPRGRVR